jgi:hypothetical protein
MHGDKLTRLCALVRNGRTKHADKLSGCVGTKVNK